MPNRNIFISILLFILSLQTIDIFAQELKIAVTFDDLPYHGERENAGYINSRLIGTLLKEDIPAIGFVNESKAYDSGKLDSSVVSLLEDWPKNGLELGNHTFSHVFINSTSISAYKEDVIKGEIITKPLLQDYGKSLRYFRHTQLRTGPTDEYRIELTEFLNDRGYTIAPVTIDNDEYLYAYCYDKAKEKGNKELMERIGEDYLRYMEEVFQHYEIVSRSHFGRHIYHILLLHANQLNADYFPSLVKLLKERDYEFISLEEALRDSVYELEAGTHARGLSWIQRWILMSGNEITPQPSVSDFISELFQNYRSQS